MTGAAGFACGRNPTIFEPTQTYYLPPVPQIVSLARCGTIGLLVRGKEMFSIVDPYMSEAGPMAP